jgi:hypothetical protein
VYSPWFIPFNLDFVCETVCVFVCTFVCYCIQLWCLSVAARRIQVRKIRDMRRIHRSRRFIILHTLIPLSHCALVPLCICRSTVCMCLCTPPGIEPSGGLGVGDFFSIGNYHTMSSINLYRVLGLNHGFEYLVGPIALQHGPHLIL